MQKFVFVLLILSMTACTSEQRPAQVAKIEIPHKTREQQILSLKTYIPSEVISARLDNQPRIKWVWPAKGEVATNRQHKGIDIAGQEGAPVKAAGDGEVIYSGKSQDGYGNLIIIKHPKNFLSAYAHNQKIMVQEGDSVMAGQKIAEMGRTGTNSVKLHFEVRENGKPIDPTEVLP